MKRSVEIIGNGGRKVTLTLEQTSQNKAANTSTVHWTVAVSDGDVTYVPAWVRATVNGETVFEDSQIVTMGSLTPFPAKRGSASGNITITHDAQGKGAANFTLEAVIGNAIDIQFKRGKLEESSRIILDEFSDASAINLSAGEITIGNSITVTKTGTGNTDVITLHLGSREASLTLGRAYTIPLEWCDMITESKDGEAYVLCETYNDTEFIAARRKYVTLTVPSTQMPAITNVSIEDTVTLPWSIYLEKASRLKIVPTATFKYGAYLKSIEVNGQTANGKEITLAPFDTHGSITLNITVTDSRGMKATTTRAVSVVEYFLPTVTGEATKDGSFSIAASGTFASCGGNNKAYVTVKFRRVGTSNWTTILNRATVTASPWAFEQGSIFATGNQEVEITVEDDVTDAGIMAPVYFSDFTGSFGMSFYNGGEGIALFEEATAEGFSVNGNTEIKENLTVDGDTQIAGDLTADSNVEIKGSVQIGSDGIPFKKLEFGRATIHFVPGYSEVTVTFNVEFTQPPDVFVSSIFGSSPLVCQREKITATSFVASVQDLGATGEREFSWIAIGV